jgi:hypothetical protein
MKRAFVLLATASVLVLTGCSGVSAPTGTSTATPEAGTPGIGTASVPDAPLAWLLTGSDDFVSGVAIVCAKDEAIADPTSQWALVGTTNPPDPDDNNPSITFYFFSGAWDMYWADGEGINATIYEFGGSWEPTKNADGVIVSGKGTGSGRIVYPDGDIDNHVKDSVQFTMEPTDPPDYCLGYWDDDGNYHLDDE